MTPILNREQCKAFDAFAIGRCKVPSALLMENAGRGAAEKIAKRLGDQSCNVVVAVGSGQNGGDGLVVARHLLCLGHKVKVYVLGKRENVRHAAQINLEALLAIGDSVRFLDQTAQALREALDGADLCVDALLGVGLNRRIEGRLLGVVAALNDATCPCVSLDVPSGLCADTGATLGAAVRADLTLAFGAYKLGLFQGDAATHKGQLELVSLGVPDAAIIKEVGHAATLIDPANVRAALGDRAQDTHKYRNGNVLVVAGSLGKTGAALLAARGALRAGAGVVAIATWDEAAGAIEGRLEEAMTWRLSDTELHKEIDAALHRRRAVVVGPGLGLDDRAIALTERIVLHWEGPVVIDADSISHFAGRSVTLLNAPGPRILTPHSGELARLMGTSVMDVEANRFAAAKEAAARTGATVVLKGCHTIVATGDDVSICGVGNPILATAGSGDVLSGMVAAVACGAKPHEATCAAVYLHALAADHWRDRMGADRGMLASEIAELVPEAIAGLCDKPS